VEARFCWMACDCLWRVRARHAVPLLRKRRQNDVAMRGKHCELWCVLTLAQAEAYAIERKLRRPEASGAKRKRKNDAAMRACLARSCCGDSLAQAGMPVLLKPIG